MYVNNPEHGNGWYVIFHNEDGLPEFDEDGAHPRSMQPWSAAGREAMIAMGVPAEFADVMVDVESELFRLDFLVTRLFGTLCLTTERLRLLNPERLRGEALVRRDIESEIWLNFEGPLTRDQRHLKRARLQQDVQNWKRLYAQAMDFWERLVDLRRRRLRRYEELVRMRRLSGMFDIYMVSMCATPE